MSRTDQYINKTPTYDMYIESVVVDQWPTYESGSGRRLTPLIWHIHKEVRPVSNYLKFFLQRVSESTPGFLSPLRTSPLPQNPFTFRRYELKSSSYWSLDSKPGTLDEPPVHSLNIFSDYCPDAQPMDGYIAVQSDIDSMDSAARSKLLTKLKNQSVNLALATAELQKTAKTVGDVALEITGLVRAARRGDLNAAMRAAGMSIPRNSRTTASSVANAAGRHVLVKEYGIAPLVNDVFGSIEAVKKARSNAVFSRASANVKRTFNESRIIDIPIPFGAVGYDRWHVVRKESVTVSYGVSFRNDIPPARVASELGLANPLSVAWDLVPYSFVVDWFLPIGSFLNNLDATLGLAFSSGYRTIFRRVSTKIIRERSFQLNGVSYSGFGSCEWERIFCNRSPLTGFPELPYPSFKNPLSFDHAKNALALLSQTLKR